MTILDMFTNFFIWFASLPWYVFPFILLVFGFCGIAAGLNSVKIQKNNSKRL